MGGMCIIGTTGIRGLVMMAVIFLILPVVIIDFVFFITLYIYLTV